MPTKEQRTSLQNTKIMRLSRSCTCFCLFHGRIIKWTQHIGFLALVEMARVVEGNRGNDLRER